MIYPYECESCGDTIRVERPPLSPPDTPPECCGQPTQRIYGCVIDTSGCKDHDDIPPEKQVQRANPVNAQRVEAAYQRDIEQKRKVAAKAGRAGSMQMTHSIPAELFHGKIRETGDRSYWDDPKNRNRHKSTRVR